MDLREHNEASWRHWEIHGCFSKGRDSQTKGEEEARPVKIGPGFRLVTYAHSNKLNRQKFSTIIISKLALKVYGSDLKPCQALPSIN